MAYGKLETEFLKNKLMESDASYAITCTGQIAALSNSPLTDTELENLRLSRNGAFDNVDYVCIDKIAANAIADILEEMDTSNLTGIQKDAVDTIIDTVNGIQYQTMIKWLDDYRKNDMKEHSTTPRI